MDKYFLSLRESKRSSANVLPGSLWKSPARI